MIHGHWNRSGATSALSLALILSLVSCSGTQRQEDHSPTTRAMRQLAATPSPQEAAAPVTGPQQTQAPPAASISSQLPIRLLSSSPEQQPADSPANRSVLDGVFTKTQAARGEMTFQSVCAACHVTQDFQGTSFIRTWAGRTAGDIFELISITMPMDDPGSLRPEDYADLVAYFFHLNGYPAGQAELSPSANRLRDVQIVAAPTSKPR